MSSKKGGNKKPKVSFVIRTKDEGRYIGKVLKYLYKQTFKDFEVIIVDSGSTDKTLGIARKFPVRIIEIRPEEFGMSYSLNLGISKAKGGIIGIISGHSIPRSNKWLADGYKNFRDKKIVGVTGPLSSNPLAYLWRPLGLPIFDSSKRVEHTSNMNNTHALIRKNMWKLYPFDEELSGSEDRDWALEMLARGYNIVSDPGFAAYHSHIVLSRSPRFRMKPTWRARGEIIDKRKRPRKSYTKIKI